MESTGQPISLDPVPLQARAADLAHRLVTPALVMTVFVPLPVAWMLRDTASPRALAGWILSLLLVTAVRYFGVRRYWADSHRAQHVQRWLRRYTLGALASGLAWSGLGTFLYPAAEVWTRTLIGFVLSGITATSLVTIGAIPSAFRSFILALFLPLSAYHLLHQDNDQTAVGIAALGFAAALMVMSRRAAHNVREMLEATARSEELARRLAVANSEVRERNLALEREARERDRAEVREAKTDARLRLALEGAGMSTWEFDLATQRMTITGGLAGDIGRQSGADGGIADFRQLVHEDDRQALRSAMEKARDADEVFRAEFRVRHQGQWRWIAALGRVLLRDDDTPGMVGVAHDVTRRKAVLAELEAAKERAEGASRAKSQFLATMSHEIRTPLNGVVGMLELLSESELQPSQRKMAEAASRSCEALLVVINDVLDLSKIEANRLELETIPFDPGHVAEEVAGMLAESAERKGLVLACRVDNALPAVMGDPSRVRQVLLNLVSNAVKFTDHGEVELSVDSHASAPAGLCQLRFSVRDTGIGMGPEEIKRLFRPFSQGDMSTSRRYGGTGLGLAISRQLVDLMKGEIGVESTEGRGSLFRVDLTLPVAAESAERSRTHFDAVRGRHALVVEDNVANRAMLEGQSSADAPPLIRPLTVLVVEDNAVNRHVATAMLQKLGCTVVVADGGEAGVRAARDAAIDLVLMDCQMPEVDGFEATRRIRAEAPDGRVLPIIALTANALHGDRERCLAAGMDDYLAKPFSSRALASMLMTWAPPAKSPPATYSSTAAVLDPGALAEVTALDPDGSLLRRIADVFLTDAPRLAADARAAAREGALDPFVYAVHTLKSCAGTVGARRLSDACHAFERAGREQKALPTEEELQGLDAAVVEAAEALTQLSGARRCSSGGVA